MELEEDSGGVVGETFTDYVSVFFSTLVYNFVLSIYIRLLEYLRYGFTIPHLFFKIL